MRRCSPAQVDLRKLTCQRALLRQHASPLERTPRPRPRASGRVAGPGGPRGPVAPAQVVLISNVVPPRPRVVLISNVAGPGGPRGPVAPAQVLGRDRQHRCVPLELLRRLSHSGPGPLEPFGPEPLEPLGLFNPRAPRAQAPEPRRGRARRDRLVAPTPARPGMGEWLKRLSLSLRHRQMAQTVEPFAPASANGSNG